MGEFLSPVIFHDDAPLIYISIHFHHPAIWNRVFDNSLFSSALSGKSSCQQFRRSSLCLSTVYTHLNMGNKNTSSYIHILFNNKWEEKLDLCAAADSLSAILYLYTRRLAFLFASLVRRNLHKKWMGKKKKKKNFLTRGWWNHPRTPTLLNN